MLQYPLRLESRQILPNIPKWVISPNGTWMDTDVQTSKAFPRQASSRYSAQTPLLSNQAQLRLLDSELHLVP